jgi:hypothetical protein
MAVGKWQIDMHGSRDHIRFVTILPLQGPKYNKYNMQMRITKQSDISTKCMHLGMCIQSISFTVLRILEVVIACGSLVHILSRPSDHIFQRSGETWLPCILASLGLFLLHILHVIENDSTFRRNNVVVRQGLPCPLSRLA